MVDEIKKNIDFDRQQDTCLVMIDSVIKIFKRKSSRSKVNEELYVSN